MALPTPVNGQITDAVTQTNVKILGDAPGQALASLFQTAAQAGGISMQNAAVQQQNGAILAQAVTTRATVILLGAAPKG
jgi:hypothetical protein